MSSADASAGSSRTLRTASTGTAKTSLRSSINIETSPFMPGSNRPPSLGIETSTGNIVTDCWITACGSIFSTCPENGRSGNASTVTVAACPGWTRPMSLSATSTRMRMRRRSAM